MWKGGRLRRSEEETKLMGIFVVVLERVWYRKQA
jgi:hypothetical protein